MKRITLVMITLMAIYFSIGTDVSETSPKNIKVLVNNAYLKMDVPPVVSQGRVLVPLRVIFEALGAEVKWDGATRRATGTKENTTVILEIDNREALLNGKVVLLDVPAAVINGRTMVPARFIAESLGAEVN
jgi:hypothetical protein